MTKQIQNKVNLQFIEEEMLSHRTERGEIGKKTDKISLQIIEKEILSHRIGRSEIGKKTENRKPHYTNFL